MKQTLTIVLVTIFAVLMLGQSAAKPASSKEHDAIRAAVLNYPEGWYEANAERMESCLHPQLVKRTIMPDVSTGKDKLREMTAKDLIGATARRAGATTPADKRRAEVEILEVYGNVASVRVMMQDWIDYLHVGKVDGEWKILNVLWEPTPEAKKRWYGE